MLLAAIGVEEAGANVRPRVLLQKISIGTEIIIIIIIKIEYREGWYPWPSS